MVGIRSQKDLRLAYESLNLIKELKAEKGSVGTGISEYEKKTKQNIREYHKKKAKSSEETRFIAGDYDSYVLLEKLPDFVKTKEQAEEIFDEDYRLIAYPSQFDCTGQKFTTGHKIVKRGDKFYCYHSISLDV